MVADLMIRLSSRKEGLLLKSQNKLFLVLASSILALIGLMATANTLFADAGNPILSTIRGDIVSRSDGKVDVYVRGQWWWDSHSSDCNTDRAGSGLALIWNDPAGKSGTDAFNGYKYTANNITVYLGTKTAVNGNPVDGMVHPSDRGNQVEGYNVAGTDYPANQKFVDPTPVASGKVTTTQTSAWRGGCGRLPLSATDSKGNPYGEATG